MSEDIKDPQAIIDSQLGRIGGEVFVMPYPVGDFAKLAKTLCTKERQFTVVSKTPATKLTVYKTPQALLVLDKTTWVMNKQSVDRIICYSTDGGKIVGNFDLKSLGELP